MPGDAQLYARDTGRVERDLLCGLDRLPVGRLPTGLPSSTVYDRLGILERMHHALYVAAREQTGREASPSAAIIDAQSA